MIIPFISFYSFRTLFIQVNSSHLINESIKALEIKTSMMFNLDFANNTFLLCFRFFFLIINLCFLILAVIEQSFNPISELIIPIGIATKEAKAEMETHTAIE